MEGNATISSISSWCLFWFLLMQHRGMIQISLSMAFSLFKSSLTHFHFPLRLTKPSKASVFLPCCIPVYFSLSSSSILHSRTNITSCPVSVGKNMFRWRSIFCEEKYASILFCFSEGFLVSLGRGWIKSIKTFYPDSYCSLHMYLNSLIHNKDHANAAKWWADWIKCTLGATCICLQLPIIQSLLRKRNAP